MSLAKILFRRNSQTPSCERTGRRFLALFVVLTTLGCYQRPVSPELSYEQEHVDTIRQKLELDPKEDSPATSSDE